MNDIVAYVFLDATLTITFDGGMNEMNKQVLKRVTLHHVKEDRRQRAYR